MGSTQANELVCCRCGYRQSVAGPMTAEDGTPLTVEEYLSLLGVVGGDLVCSDCTESTDEVIGTAQP